MVGGGAALALSTIAPTQPLDRTRKIGILSGPGATDPEWSKRFAAFKRKLQTFGWAEGKNISFETRYAVGNPDQFSKMAADLVKAKVDLTLVGSAGFAAIAQKVTTTIPIVATKCMRVLNPTNPIPGSSGTLEALRLKEAKTLPMVLDFAKRLTENAMPSAMNKQNACHDSSLIRQPLSCCAVDKLAA